MTTTKQLLLKRQHGQYKIVLLFGTPDCDWDDIIQIEVDRPSDGDDEWVEGQWYILFQKVINS